MPLNWLRNGPESLESQRALKQRRKASLLLVPEGGGGGAGRMSQTSQSDESNLLTDSLHLPQSVHLSGHSDSPIGNVRRLLETFGGADNSTSAAGHPRQTLFCEMLYLNTELAEQAAERQEAVVPVQQQLFWHQTTRWIKYEQCIEGSGTRFSKPYITLLNLAPLLQVKNCLRRGLCLLDCTASTFVRLCDLLVEEWAVQGQLGPEEGLQNLVKEILFAPKLHLIGGKLRKVNERNGNRLRRISYTDSVPSGRFSTTSFSSDSSAPDEGRFVERDERILKKLPPNTESAAILIANVSALDRPLSAFVRLTYPTLLYPEVPDHPIPVRFLFILLNSVDNYPGETVGIGRSMGALLSDDIFQKVALHCHERHTLYDAMDEFLSQIVVIPPGKCSTEARWTPEDDGETAIRHVGILYANYAGDEMPAPLSPFQSQEFGSAPRMNAAAARQRHLQRQQDQGNPLRTGTPFGGLVQDIRRKLPWFLSDFADFFRGRLSQSLASTLLIFFANLSNIITFGAVMERSLHHQMASIENIISGAISGILFGLLSGQPLNILSATGPTLIFEKILFDFCTTNHWEFLPFRFYVGAWMAFFLLLLVVFDASALVSLITRFTEEAFATLISIVFIIQAFEKLFEISYEAPITRHPQEVLHSACYCIIQTEEWNSTIFKNLSVGVSRCLELGGEPQGLQCYFKPDVYMFSILLTCGTFLIAYSLNRFRLSRYFTFRMRNLLSDFGVLIAIISLTLITYLIGLEVPSLKMPASIRPTMDRDWLVDVTNIDNHKVALIAALPAMFYTILIVMDQQITAVIINRRDNKLRKGGGYHLDLLVVAILVLICSLLGLPFYVAATVLSVMHVECLKQNVDAVPGEPPRFLGIKEQRLTAIFAHILIGCSVFLTPLIKVVPVPVLTGIFFYMGVISLLGQQFVQRIGLLFMPVKYQPDYPWIRNVPIKRVHIFTCIQLLSIGALLAIKYSSSTLSMMFPMMLIFTVLLRMLLLERLFTARELKALDDELPRFMDVIRPAINSNNKHNADANNHHQMMRPAATKSIQEMEVLHTKEGEEEEGEEKEKSKTKR